MEDFSVSLLICDRSNCHEGFFLAAFLSPLRSGVVGLRDSFTLSNGTGEEVRWSMRAGVLDLLGLALGVDGLPRVDGGFGEAAGLGEAVLPFGVAGEDGRLDKGLGLEGEHVHGQVKSKKKKEAVGFYSLRPVCPEKKTLLDCRLKHCIIS